MLSLRGAWWLAGGLWAAASGAVAQTGVATLHPAAACIAPVDGAEAQPAYPERALDKRDTGTVEVELTFADATSAPRFTLLRNKGDQTFVDAVRAHALALRAPCLQPADGAAVVRREYRFTPGGVHVSRSSQTPQERERQRALLACIKTAGGGAPRSPKYPWSALRDGVSGRVVAELMFNSPNDPPNVRLHHSPLAAPLAKAVGDDLEGWRMACHQGGPAYSRWQFNYSFEGEPPAGFKGLGFRTFLGSVKGVDSQRLAIDTREMGCPFDVLLSYLQPYLPNDVAELNETDTSNPARAPLLDWLANAELDLTRLQHRAVFGDRLTLTVPCIVIDLKPKEKNP